MKLLTTTTAINKELTRLLRECVKCQIAVAWASVGFDAFALLKEHCAKIERMVVGTHFYQTHPSFIQEFLTHPNVRFVRNTDELFHPKLYLFGKVGGAWECIVGSPNFTQGGFGGNDEMAALLTSADQGAIEALAQINASLQTYWEKASPFSSEEYEAYKEAWKRKRPILKNLRGRFGDPTDENADDKGRPPLDVPILRMTWPEYFDKVKTEKVSQYGHTMDARLKVIQIAQRLFSENLHFNKIDPDGQRKIAGLVGKEDGVDYRFFGSMMAARCFKAVVKDNDPDLSLALDMVPATGIVSREMYLDYVDQYKKAFPNGGHGVATASRLLAMKRPDTFVCFDSKNSSQLCTAFGIRGSVGYEKYWDSIIARIMEARWWCSPPPTSTVEREVWEARAAFLDSIYYEANA